MQCTLQRFKIEINYQREPKTRNGSLEYYLW